MRLTEIRAKLKLGALSSGAHYAAIVALDLAHLFQQNLFQRSAFTLEMFKTAFELKDPFLM